MNMEKLVKIAKEASQKSHSRNTVIVFLDGTIATTTGSWTANKPVWSSFDGKISVYEAIAQLVSAYETKDGIPAYPPGYTKWRTENPDMAQKIDAAEFGEWRYFHV